MKLVVIESPLRGNVPEWMPERLAGVAEWCVRQMNLHYAKACIIDSLRRGEAPYASHVLFDQPGLLNDAVPKQREWGLRSGIYWGRAAELRAVYCDRGISDGMRAGVASSPETQLIEFRWLMPERPASTVATVRHLEKMIAFRRGQASGGGVQA